MLDVLNRLRPHMTTYVATAYRTHTLGEIQSEGAELVGQEVTVAGSWKLTEVKEQYVLLI